MTAVRTVDSLKYGTQLFAYFLGVALVGGGGIVLGVALAEPQELPGGLDVLAPGSSGTAQTAGGYVLVALGASVVVIGVFGLLYKLVADSVAAGIETGTLDGHASPTDEEPTEAGPSTETEETAAVAATSSHGDALETDVTREEDASEEPTAVPETEPGGDDGGQSRPEPDPGPAEPSFENEPSTETDPGDEWTQPAGQADPESSSTDATEEKQPESDVRERREPSPEEIAFGTDSGTPASPPEDTGDVDLGDHTEDRPPEREAIEDAGHGSPEPPETASDPLAEPTEDE